MKTMPPTYRSEKPIQIQEMDFNMIRGSAHIGLYGDPGMGKTRMAKRIAKFLIEVRKVQRVVVVVGNPDTASEWYHIVPELNVYSCKNPEHISQLDDIFEYSAHQVAKLREEHQESRVDTPFMVPKKYQYLAIFDDTGGDSDFMKTPTVYKFATESRHGAFTTIWNLQYISMLPKKARTLHTHLGIFNTVSHTQIDYIYKEYTGKKIDKRKFEKLLGRLTPKPNHLMWIDKSPETPRTFSNMFRYFVNEDMSVISACVDRLEDFNRSHYLSDSTRTKIDDILSTANEWRQKMDGDDTRSSWSWQSQMTETLDRMDPRMLAKVVGARTPHDEFAVTFLKNHQPTPTITPFTTTFEHFSSQLDDVPEDRADDDADEDRKHQDA
jgi:hypothetical protein